METGIIDKTGTSILSNMAFPSSMLIGAKPIRKTGIGYTCTLANALLVVMLDLPLSLGLLLLMSGTAPLAKAQNGDSLVTIAPTAHATPSIVIGFLGGHVQYDNPVHTEVQLAAKLRTLYPTDVHIETFENRRIDKAHKTILNLLEEANPSASLEEGKRNARVILYGHSWGANAVVALARELQKEGIRVLLTVQVDSIAKIGQNDSLIPENVERAANFYQPDGFFHGRSEIRAVNPQKTQIVGNFKFDYKQTPVACPGYPWFSRIFMKSHIEIECDPKVWNEVETMIRSALAPPGLAVESAAK